MAARAPKRRKLTPPGSDDEEARGTTKISRAFMKNAATWDLERDYEHRRRLLAKKGKKESQRLPLKTPDGRLHQAVFADDEVVSDPDNEEWPEEEQATSPSQPEAVAEEPSVPESQLIHEAKEELAKIAVALNEEPEENMSAFKALAKIGESRILAIQKLTIATQMAVYKDVIPGYRIRPHTEDAKGEKVSKDTRKLWAYEQALVSGYQAYVKELTRLAKLDPAAQQPNGKGKGKGRGQTINNLAIACACTLLTSVPHFNFRSELLRILVNKLSRRPAGADPDFDRCIAALETLFADDDDGTPSFDAVSLLSKMMRARDYRVDERVLNLFLRLQLLAGFAGKASHDRVDKPGDGGAESGGQGGKRPKQKREFRNKRVRKEMREQKKLDQDMALADASVGHEERDRMQSETLKLVFATYFRVLKLRVPHLMGAVLEGLARYAHLINQDFFGDLLEALKDLVRQSEGNGPEEEEQQQQQQQQESNGITGTDAAEDLVVRDTSREALLCTVTAFTLLAGQDAHNARSTLHLDLTFFTQHLYQSLLSICTAPDLEITSRSLRLDPDNPAGQAENQTTSTSANRVNLHTTTVLLLRCLTSVLLPPWNARSVPPLRLAAFAKQILTAALHLPDKSAQAALALLDDVAHAHGPKIAALWNTEERRADGTFNPLAASAEASNPFAATVWEGELLRRHFSPKVREGLRLLEKSIGG